jgi:hypothetical protein
VQKRLIPTDAGFCEGNLLASRRCLSTAAARRGSLAAARGDISLTAYRTVMSDMEIIMISYRSALIAAVAIVAAAGAAHAETLKPVQAHKVDLGGVAGVAYYTQEQDGHRLVVSLQAPESATPLRFATTLAPGQTVTLSVPRQLGEPPVNVHFVRQGEKIEVNVVGVAPHVEAQQSD